VEKQLLVERKVARALDDSHCFQCINYLKGTGLRLCLSLNFARPKPEIKRFAHGI
jgi:GxxExxY protein